MHDTPISSAHQSDSQIAGPGGGDTEIAIDHTGKVFYADLAALTDLKVATWDNANRKMQTALIDLVGSGQGANGYDRQWFGLWDPPDVQAARAATGYTGPLPVNSEEQRAAVRLRPVVVEVPVSVHAAMVDVGAVELREVV